MQIKQEKNSADRISVFINGLLLFLIARSFFAAFMLEPTNDEGLWLINARSQVWNLPAYGIAHSALSPLNYYICWALFLIAHPSILLIRLFNVVCFTGSLYCLAQAFKRNGLHQGACVLLFFVLVDPYLFRAISWAILEPKLIAGCAIVYLWIRSNRSAPTRSVILGVLVGLLLALKATMVWLFLGLIVYHIAASKIRELFPFVFSALLIAVGLYVFVWIGSDHARFLEVWMMHASRKTEWGAGWLAVVQAGDLRVYFYAIVVLGYLIAQLAMRPASEWIKNPVFISALLATILFSQQASLAERYLLPVAFFCLMDGCWTESRKLGKRSFSVLVAAGLTVTIAANGFYLWRFLVHPKNEGGKALTRMIDESAHKHEKIAAPAQLIISLNYPVQITSTNLANQRVLQKPDLYIHQSVAAETSWIDQRYQAYFQTMGIIPKQVGFYSVYRQDRPSENRDPAANTKVF